jgi:hypothetical protein
VTIVDWTPSVDDVASLTFARAKGRWAGGDTTENPVTFEHPDRVQAAIDSAVAIVAPQVGGDSLDEQFWLAARAVVAYRVAWALEVGSWPDQARPDKSPAEQWKELYQEALAGLTAGIVRFRDEGPDEGPGGSQLPQGAFPLPGLPCRSEMSLTDW